MIDRRTSSSLAGAGPSSSVVAGLGLIGAFCLLQPSPSVAQSLQEIYPRVLDDQAPPGGTLQLKVQLTEPRPITTGNATVGDDGGEEGPLGLAEDVALFAPDGLVSGAAVVGGHQLSIRFSSRDGTFGTGRESPILAVNIPVRPDATPGQTAGLNLDPSRSFWVAPSGQTYLQQVQAGQFSVGGAISIVNVLPGGGLVPAGSTVTVSGIGFQPGASVEIRDVELASTVYVDPTRLEVVLAADAQMHGKRVRVTNQDGSSAVYYSYLRATMLGVSRLPLLAATFPIFSTHTFTRTFFLPVDGPLFLGLAFQNPNADSAVITIELFSLLHQLIGSSSFSLPPQTKISREISEYFSGVGPGLVSYLLVSSTVPVQEVGLVGDELGGTVVPVDPIDFAD